MSHKNENALDEWTKKRLEETLDTESEGKILSGQARNRALPSTELQLDVPGEEISTKPTKIPHEASSENSASPESTLISQHPSAIKSDLYSPLPPYPISDPAQIQPWRVLVSQLKVWVWVRRGWQSKDRSSNTHPNLFCRISVWNEPELGRRKVKH